MAERIDESYLDRTAIIDAIIDELAAEKGISLPIAKGRAVRRILTAEAAKAYLNWRMRVADGGITVPETRAEALLKRLCDLDNREPFDPIADAG